MAFFLIGRGPDNDLRLISPKAFESRQAAMAELSLLSAEPSFAHWDAEVSVMDLDSGAPVLLVRSAVAAAPAAEPVIVPADAAGAWQADIPEAEVHLEEPAPEAIAETDAAPLEVVSEPEPAVPERTFATEIASQASDSVPDAIEAPTWEPPAVALIEDQAIADAIADAAWMPEPEPEPEPERQAIPVPEPAPVPIVDVPAAPEPPQEAAIAAPVFDENDELRAAILRTAEHMSAEGVVPPESVGLTPTEASAEPQASSSEDEHEAEPPVAETAQSAPAAIATEATPAAAEAPAPPKIGFWPWARAANSTDVEGAGVAPEVAGVYDALQEPATGLPEPDVEAALRDSVLLPADESVEAPDDDSDAHLPMSSLPSAEPSPFAPAAAGEPVDSSDFILDLDAVESTPLETAETTAAPVAPAPVASAPLAPVPTASDAWSFGGPETSYEAEPLPAEPAPQASDEPVAPVSPLQDYTCEDCVYVTTCPNRDQRLPKDCGSFQWR